MREPHLLVKLIRDSVLYYTATMAEEHSINHHWFINYYYPPFTPLSCMKTNHSLLLTMKMVLLSVQVLSIGSNCLHLLECAKVEEMSRSMHLMVELLRVSKL